MQVAQYMVSGYALQVFNTLVGIEEPFPATNGQTVERVAESYRQILKIRNRI
jgi:hypothetical protein